MDWTQYFRLKRTLYKYTGLNINFKLKFMKDEFSKHKRTELAEMRPYVEGEDMKDISVSQVDTPEVGGWIARNPEKHTDQWYVTKDYYAKNLIAYSEDTTESDSEDVKEPAMTSSGLVTFGLAVQAMKEGKRVTRLGWNGKGMFLYLVPATEFTSICKHAKKHFGESTPYRAYFALKTAQNDVATWAPSGSDALAEDWQIIPN